MSDIRQASLQPDSGERIPGAVWQAGPFAILLAGAVWLYRSFDGLPARIPVHWNWRGEADRFVARTALGAGLPLLIGTAICALMLTMQRALRRSAPRGAMRGPSIRLVLLGEYLAALVCSGAVAASVTGGRLVLPVVAIALAGALLLIGVVARLARRGPQVPLRNPKAWRGLFYFDRNDPALLVPKRLGFGYTLNFGHPGAIVLSVAILLVPVVAVAIALLAR